MGVLVVFLTKCSQRDFARHGQGGGGGNKRSIFEGLSVCVRYMCVCVCVFFPGLWISVCLTLAGYSLTWWSFKGQTASSTTTTKYSYQSVTGCNEVQDIVLVVVIVVVVVVVVVDMGSIDIGMLEEEEEEDQIQHSTSRKFNAVCVTETSKCKKIKHKITGKSVLFVTSIPIHS